MYTRRLLTIVFCLFILEILLLGKVAWIQIKYATESKREVDNQATCEITFWPRRGGIYDRYHRTFAASIKTKSLYTIPKKLENPRATARLLAERGYGSCQMNMNEFEKHPGFVWIQRHIDCEANFSIDGVYITDDVKRVYPLGLASPVIGITDGYDKGLSGIELQFNTILKGEPCTVIMGRTPAGRLYPDPGYVLKEPEHGYDIILTIDAEIQSVIEEELQKGIKKFNAKGGMAIVIDPKTGEILGIASSGSNGNCVVSSQYEPGSTFKIVTLACVLEDSLVSFDTIVEDGTGFYVVEKKVIKDDKEHGPFTLREAVARSSNVAFINLAGMTGPERIYEMALLFGFGQKTRIALPAEVSGNIYPPSEWSPLRLANVAFGQGVSCSFLQLSMAYACVANDGILLRPYIVKEIIGHNGEVINTGGTEIIRRVIDESTAREMVELLRGVVSDSGTGVLAQVKGLDVAGKTGTAQKFKDGMYSEDYISSFVGFFPADEPSFVIGVLIDEPEEVHFGSLVAAPVFREMATRIISSEMIAGN